MGQTKLKTLYTYQILQKYTDSDHKMSAEAIAKQINREHGITVERKGVYRDIEALVEYGIDIKKTSNGFYLDKRDFMPAEIRLLVSAVQSSAFITPSKTKRLVEILTSGVSVYQKKSLMKQVNLGCVKYSNEEIYNNIDVINYAISQKRKISFFYYKKALTKLDKVQHDGRRYMVSPYAMIWYQGHYYLVCNLDKHEGLTHFRIDRIRGIECEHIGWRPFSEVSEFKTTFNASKYAAYCVNMFGGEVGTVTLRCKNERINEVLERFGEKIPITRDTLDTFITTVDVAISDGLISWIAQYFDSIEVVSPDSIRTRIVEKLRSTLSMYETDKGE